MNLGHKECWNRTDLVKAKRHQLSKVAAALTALVALAVLGGPSAVFAQDTP
jgi:DNA-binding IclR family transcriptional regulator